MSYSEYSLLVAMGLLGLLASGIAFRSSLGTPRFAIIISVLAIAGGSWLTLTQGTMKAAILLALGVALLTAANWLCRNKALDSSTHLQWRAELVVVIAILVGAAALRFTKLESFPDFIHGEESLWTWISATASFSNETPWPVNGVTSGVPVSFWMEQPFFRFHGLDYYTPRYAMAFYGTLASALFYLVGRTLIGPRAAIVALIFFATSMVTLASSRAGYVQGPVLFWSIVAVLLYVQAVKSRSVILYLLAGVSLVSGSLTYQTFLTVVAAIVLHAGFSAIRELVWTRRSALPITALSSLLLILPMAAIWPSYSDYLDSMRGYSTSRSGSLTEIEGAPWEAPREYLTQLLDNSQILATELFRRQAVSDFLVTNGDGPVVLPAIMALALVGLSFTIPRAAERWNSLILLWLFIALTFSPVLLGAPMLRTFLPAYPALFLAAGIGLVRLVDILLPLTQSERLGNGLQIAVLIAVLAVGSLGALIYFNKTASTLDGAIRWSFVNEVLPQLDSDTWLVLPHAPSASDWFDVERNAIRFAVAGRQQGFRNVDDYYTVGSYEKTITMLQSGHKERNLIAVRTGAAGPPAAAEAAVKGAVERCYPGTEWTNVTHFAYAVIPRAVPSECNATLTITPERVAERNPTALAWKAPYEAGPFLVTVERRDPGVIVMEMEDFPSSNGWGSEARYAADYSGRGYFFDDVNATSVSLSVSTPPGSYTLWLRTYRRVADETHRYLTVGNEGPVEIAPPTITALNEWVWESFGPYKVDGSDLSLLLRREGKGPALFIDVLYLASRADFDPRANPVWLTVLEETSGSNPAGEQSFPLPLSLPPGDYRWHVTALGPGIVDGLGNKLSSELSSFKIQP